MQFLTHWKILYFLDFSFYFVDEFNYHIQKNWLKHQKCVLIMCKIWKAWLCLFGQFWQGKWRKIPLLLVSSIIYFLNVLLSRKTIVYNCLDYYCKRIFGINILSNLTNLLTFQLTTIPCCFNVGSATPRGSIRVMPIVQSQTNFQFPFKIKKALKCNSEIVIFI